MFDFERPFKKQVDENILPLFAVVAVELPEYYKQLYAISETEPTIEIFYEAPRSERFIRLTWSDLPQLPRNQNRAFCSIVQSLFPPENGRTFGLNYMGDEFLMVFHHLHWLPLVFKDKALIEELKEFFKYNSKDY